MRIAKPDLPTTHIVRRRPLRKEAAADLQHFGHEMANQLTVINLCCGKIRRYFSKTTDTGIVAECDRIEKTVEECVQILRRIDQQNPLRTGSAGIARHKLSDLASATNSNVYPLFDGWKQRRTQD